MQELFLTANPVLLGMAGLNMLTLVSLLGTTISQRSALSRLERTLRDSNTTLAQETVIGILNPSIAGEITENSSDTNAVFETASDRDTAGVVVFR